MLTKAFYLLKDFRGASRPASWVEARRPRTRTSRPTAGARRDDGVSSIVITSNDMVGAWAIRPDGQAMLPIVSGEARQREFAFRAGVNIVMYTLTGNYKGDQVHIRRCWSGWAVEVSGRGRDFLLILLLASSGRLITRLDHELPESHSHRWCPNTSCGPRSRRRGLSCCWSGGAAARLVHTWR